VNGKEELRVGGIGFKFGAKRNGVIVHIAGAWPGIVVPNPIKDFLARHGAPTGFGEGLKDFEFPDVEFDFTIICYGSASFRNRCLFLRS
jgi:hypothetical protein